jgi:predicted aspartyl protease
MTQVSSGTRFPYLQIHVQIGTPRHIEQELNLEALVDTGFDGGVTVPPGSVDAAIVPDIILDLGLADGSRLRAPGYLASVRIGTLQPVLTMLIALGDEPLLGREVLDNFRVTFDHGREILVEP